MAKQFYYDLTPGFEDVPPETWADIDPTSVRDRLVNQVPEEDRHKMGPETDLITLVRLGRAAHTRLEQPLQDSVRLFTNPRLRALLLEQFKREYLEEADNMSESKESIQAAFARIDHRYSDETQE